MQFLMSPAPVLYMTQLHPFYTDPTPENRKREEEKTLYFFYINEVQRKSAGSCTNTYYNVEMPANS